MKEIDRDKLEKLPIWAKDYIKSLERELKTQTDIVNDYINGLEDTSVSHKRVVNDHSINIPNDSLVKFDEKSMHRYFEVNREEDSSGIYLEVRGSTQLRLVLDSSNLFKVYLNR